MKNIKILAGTIALATIVGANAWNAATVFNSSELNVANLENIAEAEPGDGGDDEEMVPHWFETEVTVKIGRNKIKVITEYVCDQAPKVSNDRCVPGTSKVVKVVERYYEEYHPTPTPPM